MIGFGGFFAPKPPASPGLLVPEQLTLGIEALYGTALNPTRMLLGPRPELTAEERAAAEEKRRDTWRRYRKARLQLASLRGVARVVLDLHIVDEHGYCQGDDFGGWESEPPSWPCRTVLAIAQRHEIDLPESTPWGEEPA